MATNYPPPNPEFIQARHRGGAQKPKAIVLHGTVSSDNRGTARNIALWWNGPNSPVSSAHYVVDPGKIIQCVGDHTIAFHCGFNTGSIGVEFCDEQTGPASRWSDADSTAILRRAARLVAELCLAYGISAKRPTIAELKQKGPHGIYGHNDSRLAFGHTTHTDPREFPWAKFMRMVRREIRQIKREAQAPRRTFKVLHAPLHGPTATRRELRKALNRKYARVAFSEAWRQSDWLLRRKAWRVFTGDDGYRDANGRVIRREVVLAVRRGRRHLEHGVIKISEESVPLRIAPERNLVYSVDRIYGKVTATIALHPNAAVRQAWDSRRAYQYRQSMKKLAILVRHLRRKYGDNIAIVILGDMNYIDIDDGRRHTPRSTFESLDLRWISRGLDWVAYSKNLRLVSKKIIPGEENGQNHPWIEAEFARR